LVLAKASSPKHLMTHISMGITLNNPSAIHGKTDIPSKSFIPIGIGSITFGTLASSPFAGYAM
jgi:hypothetical protein